jgi:hypothetical protein
MRSALTRLALLLVLPACTGTETDNPTADMTPRPPPPYESPIDFVPDRGSPPGCVPPPNHGKPRELPRWGSDGSQLVGADRYAGLRVVDASDPSAPQLVGQHALAGTPHAVLVEPGPFVTVALDELVTVRGDEVPPPDELEAVTRLVRYDARDPLQITRVAAIDVEGELWSLSQRGDLTWVMSARVVDDEPLCDSDPYRCHYTVYDAVVLNAYRLSGDEYEQVQRVELPMNRHAWATPEGFAAFDARADALGEPDGGVLRSVRFAGDGLLGATSELQLPRQIAEGAALSLADDRARVVLRDLSDGTSELAIYDLSSGMRLGSLPGLRPEGGVRFSARAAYYDDQGSGQALVIDTTDPSAPRAAVLPTPTAQLWPLDPDGTRLLGVGEDRAQGALVLTLLQAAAGGFEVLDQETVAGAQSVASGDRLWLRGDHLLYAYAQPGGETRLDVVAIGDGSLTRHEVALGGYADEVVVAGGIVYAPDAFGLTVGSLGPSSTGAARLTWGEQIEAYVADGEREAALVQRLGAPLALQLTFGAETTSLPASPGASRLIADGDRLLVLSTEPLDQCMQSGLDCTGYVPNVEIYRFDGEPARIASVPLPDAGLNAHDTDSQVRLEWNEVEGSPLALGDGRFMFAARLYATCTRDAACEQLGIEPRPLAEANVAPAGGTSCPPAAATCSPPPALATVYGKKDALRFYVLDTRAVEPRFGLIAESVLELGDSRFGRPSVSEGVLLVPRLERAPQRPTPGQPSTPGAPKARFMVDRFPIVEDGGPSEPVAINVPGYGLALRAGGEVLISVEPNAAQGNGATLHRLALRDDGAHVLQSLALEGTYGQLELAGDHAIYLQRRGEGCDSTTRLTPVQLPADADDELGAGPGLELPGVSWTLIDARGDRLLLQSDSLRYAVVELEDGAPTLLEFVAVSGYMADPRLTADGAIVGASSFWGEQRIEL